MSLNVVIYAFCTYTKEVQRISVNILPQICN